MHDDQANHPPVPPMPPDEVLASLPEKDIPADLRRCRSPLVMLPDDAVVVVNQKTNLGIAAKVVAEETTDPARFLNALVEAGETTTALDFLAWALPKRLGLWWAFQCCWSTMLDRERNLARLGAGDASAQSGAEEEEPTPPFDVNSYIKETMEKHGPKLEAAAAEADAALPELQAGLQKVAENLARRHAGPASPAALSEFQQSINRARSFRLKLTEARIRSKAGQKQPNPLVIQHPEPARKSADRKRKGRSSKPHHPLHARIFRRQHEAKLQGMALCLQWILDPCQKNAAAAAEALPDINHCPVATSLAKATFWCGENMSLDPEKPQVPPPETLAPKGISTAITKAAGIKETSWSRADKTTWYLHQGLEIAAGRQTWDHADERFDRYMAVALGDLKKDSDT